MGNSSFNLGMPGEEDPNAFDPSMYNLGIDGAGEVDPNAVDNSQFSTGANLKGAGGDALSGAGMGAMFGPYGAAAGAGLGLIKYFAFDKPGNDRKRQLAATTEKFSPWTGLHGDVPGQINPMSAGISGAGMGASMGQNVANQQANNDLKQAQIGYLQSRALAAPGTQTSLPFSGQEEDPLAQNRWMNHGLRPVPYTG